MKTMHDFGTVLPEHVPLILERSQDDPPAEGSTLFTSALSFAPGFLTGGVAAFDHGEPNETATLCGFPLETVHERAMMTGRYDLMSFLLSPASPWMYAFLNTGDRLWQEADAAFGRGDLFGAMSFVEGMARSRKIAFITKGELAS